MSKVLELLSPSIANDATEYLRYFQCSFDDMGREYECSLVPSDEKAYRDLAIFIDGGQASPELVCAMLLYLSEGIPDDEFARLRWATRELQQHLSRKFWPEDDLMRWGISDGEKWVDRSLRVVNDVSFNQKMYDRNGDLRLKNIFVHANYQYIYHCSVDILTFLHDHPYEKAEKEKSVSSRARRT